jgi:hypothetical protein
VERAFAIVILDERYEGCAMYPNMESVMNERAVFDRRMSRDELIGKKMSAREVYSNEEYSLRLSKHRRCICLPAVIERERLEPGISLTSTTAVI